MHWSNECEISNLLSKPGLWLVTPLYTSYNWSFLGDITRITIQATLERWETISHWQRLKDIKTPTREGIGSIVQECGIRNREFLSLTTPRTIGDAPWLWTGVGCGKKNYGTWQNWETITWEIIHFATELWSNGVAGGMEATARNVFDLAGWITML